MAETMLPQAPDGEVRVTRGEPRTHTRLQVMRHCMERLKSAKFIPTNLPEAFAEHWNISTEAAAAVLNRWGRKAFAVVPIVSLRHCGHCTLGDIMRWVSLTIPKLGGEPAPAELVSKVEAISTPADGFAWAMEVQEWHSKCMGLLLGKEGRDMQYVIIPLSSPEEWVTRELHRRDARYILWNPLLVFVAQAALHTWDLSQRLPISCKEWAVSCSDICRSVVLGVEGSTSRLWAPTLDDPQPRVWTQRLQFKELLLSVSSFVHQDWKPDLLSFLASKCTELKTEFAHRTTALWCCIPHRWVQKLKHQRAWSTILPNVWHEHPEVVVVGSKEREGEGYKQVLARAKCPFAPLLPWVASEGMVALWVVGPTAMFPEVWSVAVDELHQRWCTIMHHVVKNDPSVLLRDKAANHKSVVALQQAAPPLLKHIW